MNRVSRSDVAEEVTVALSLFPEPAHRFLQFDVFVGDPVFAGIGKYGAVGTDGRSYRETAHVCYPWHVRDRRTTIVLPTPIGVPFTVHELAHVLDFSLGFSVECEPVTQYAQTSRAEAFAEYVSALLVPNYLSYDPLGEEYVRPQRRALAQLAELGIQ